MSRLINLANTGKTQNGDKNFNSTGSYLLDFFSKHGASVKPNPEFLSGFKRAFKEDPENSLKCLFYFRDIRGGQAIRTNFRDVVSNCSDSNKSFEKLVVRNLKHVPEYGRWDDLVDVYFNTKSEAIKKECFRIVATQLKNDLENLNSGSNVSLLGKWLPSENTYSKETCKRATHLRRLLFADLDENRGRKTYRKVLSALRAKIKIVESQMCQNKWDEINFSAVPSKAMFKYRKAFGKKMPEKFTNFIEKAKKGEVKINSSTLFPAEIIKKFIDNNGHGALEAQWNQLPNYCNDDRNALVVADVSGSMFHPDRNPISCSIALAIYFAQRNKGVFKDSFITFSAKPTICKIDGSQDLQSIVNFVQGANWSMNTDLDAVFNLILDTAVKHKLNEEEMPSTLYIVSDMQFDACGHSFNSSALERINEKYSKAGYEVPHIVFWQVNSDAPGFPASKYGSGVTLCSGYSPSFFANVAKKSHDPSEAMMEVLSSERYARIK